MFACATGHWVLQIPDNKLLIHASSCSPKRAAMHYWEKNLWIIKVLPQSITDFSNQYLFISLIMQRTFLKKSLLDSSLASKTCGQLTPPHQSQFLNNIYINWKLEKCFFSLMSFLFRRKEIVWTFTRSYDFISP